MDTRDNQKSRIGPKTGLIEINGERVTLLVREKLSKGGSLFKKERSEITHLAEGMEQHEDFLQSEPIARTVAAVCDFYDQGQVGGVRNWQLVLKLEHRPQNPEDLALILKELTGQDLKVETA